MRQLATGWQPPAGPGTGTPGWATLVTSSEPSEPPPARFGWRRCSWHPEREDLTKQPPRNGNGPALWEKTTHRSVRTLGAAARPPPTRNALLATLLCFMRPEGTWLAQEMPPAPCSAQAKPEVIEPQNHFSWKRPPRSRHREEHPPRLTKEM